MMIGYRFKKIKMDNKIKIKYKSCSEYNDKLIEEMVINKELPSEINTNNHDLPKDTEVKINQKLFSVDDYQYVVENSMLYKCAVLYYECNEEQCNYCNKSSEYDFSDLLI
mgnify:CR=1 FL=1